LDAEGLGATEIANALGIGRASVYRLLDGDGTSGVTTKRDPLEDGPEVLPTGEEPVTWLRRGRDARKRDPLTAMPVQTGAIHAEQAAIGGGLNAKAPKRDPLEDGPG
jgi:hypothetical protein